MMRKLIKSESGVILPMAMILLLAGSILIVPLLNSVSTGLLISQRIGGALPRSGVRAFRTRRGTPLVEGTLI